MGFGLSIIASLLARFMQIHGYKFPRRPLEIIFAKGLTSHILLSGKGYVPSEEVVGMSVIDELLKNNEHYVESFDKGHLPPPPSKRVAIVACMDARLHLRPMLGLGEGDVHIIRNAGGVVTDDVIRSLVISQRLLGTEEIMLIHHTDCGMLKFNDQEFREQVQDEVGIKPHFPMESFSDLEQDVHQSIARIKASPFIRHKDSVRGFIYEVETGRLREVT